MRLNRLRTTAFPTFYVTVIPRRPKGKVCSIASASRWRPWSLRPPDWTARNSARRRSRISFVMRLVRTLHGISPEFAERDRYAIGTGVSRTLVRSSIADEFALRSQTRICYLRQSFSCGQLVKGGTGDGLEVAVDNFWNGCSLSVVRRSLTS